MRRGVAALAVSLLGASWAQQVVSARAGLVHYLEGRVLADGKRIRMKVNRFPQLAAGQTVATAQRARVEILLNPATFLRLGEASSFRLASDDLADTRVELLSGAAIVDVRALENQNRVTILAGGVPVELREDGLYQFTPARVRVYDGEAAVGAIRLTRGWEVAFGSTPLAAVRFDRKDTDSLYLWSEQRAKALNPPVPVRRRLSNPPLVFPLLGR